MSNRISNLVAQVAQPNTPETDAMPEVDHIVEYTLDGVEHSITISAAEPGDAIDKVRRMVSEGLIHS